MTQKMSSYIWIQI